MPGLIITFIIAIASGVFITTGLDKISTQAPQPSPRSQIENPTARTFTPRPSPSTKPTPKAQAPKVDSPSQITCTGPDGKQFQTTQKECDEFNAAWENVPTTTSRPTNQPSSFYSNYDIPEFKTVECELSYGTYELSAEYCETSKLRDQENQKFYANLQEIANQNPSASDKQNNEEPVDYTYENSRCKQEARDEYNQERTAVINKLRSLNAMDSSAYVTAMKVLERDLNQANGDCNHYFPID